MLYFVILIVVVFLQGYAAIFVPIPVKVDPATQSKTAELIRLVSLLDEGKLDLQDVIRRQHSSNTEQELYHLYNYNIRENDTSAPIDVFTNFTLKLLEINHEGTSGYPPTYVTSNDWGRRRLVTRGVRKPMDRSSGVQSPAALSTGDGNPGIRSSGLMSPVKDIGVRDPRIKVIVVRDPEIKNIRARYPGIKNNVVRDPGIKNFGVRDPWINSARIRTHVIRSPGVLESYLERRKSAALDLSESSSSEKQRLLSRRESFLDDGWKSILDPTAAESNENQVEDTVHHMYKYNGRVSPFKNEPDMLDDENNKFMRHSKEQNDGDIEKNSIYVHKANRNANRDSSNPKGWRKPHMAAPNQWDSYNVQNRQIRAEYRDDGNSNNGKVSSNSFLEDVWDKTTKNWEEINSDLPNKRNTGKRGEQRYWDQTEKHDSDMKNKISNWDERHSNVDKSEENGDRTESKKLNNHDWPTKLTETNYDWESKLAYKTTKLEDWDQPITKSAETLDYDTKSPDTTPKDNNWDQPRNWDTKSQHKTPREVDWNQPLDWNTKSPYRTKKVDEWDQLEYEERKFKDEWGDFKPKKEKYDNFDKPRPKNKKKQNVYTTDHRNNKNNIGINHNSDWHVERERQVFSSKTKKEKQRDNWDRLVGNSWKKPTRDWERPNQRPKKKYGLRDSGPYTRTAIPYIGKKGIYEEVED